MAEETWFVAMDGRQLEGARPIDEVRELIKANPGKKLMVWNEKMTGWAEPATLPAFRESPAAPAPEPAAATPPPRPQPGAAVAAAVAASAPAARETIQHEARFFRGLLDFKFEELITPKIIRTLYIISTALIALGWLAMVVAGSRFGGGTAIIGVVYLVLSPVIAILELTFMRMFFELVLVMFRIKDGIVHIEESARAGR